MRYPRLVYRATCWHAPEAFPNQPAATTDSDKGSIQDVIINSYSPYIPDIKKQAPLSKDKTPYKVKKKKTPRKALINFRKRRA